MLQSLVRKPDQELFWSTDELIVTPFFRSVMSYKRFSKLKQYLHFADNENYDPATHENPKLNKIFPVFQILNEKFKNLYTPMRDVTIDESLLLFKGRLGWIQYIPLKRARFGIKTYMLCEAKSGYICSCIIYTGKGTILDKKYKDLPMSSQVVMTLMEPLFNKGYCLTTDNFYTSPQLADLLLQNKTDTYGTVRLNRKEIPPDLLKTKLKPGEIAAYQRGKVLALKWKDKKDVSVLSTVHNASMVEVGVKRKRSEENATKKKPAVVIDYNDTMGGVDRVDQHLADYPLPRKRGKKYYVKIFFHLVEQALWNSYQLYLKCNGKKTAFCYRLEVIRRLVQQNHCSTSSPRRGRPGPIPPPLRLTGRHFPEVIPPTAKKQNPTRQCGMCSRVRTPRNKKIRRETRYYCPDCNVPLCVTPCFRAYHTAPTI